jgi:hypothetical protein
VARHRKSFRPNIFTKRKERVMPPKILHRRFHAVVDSDLFDGGIALHIKNALAFQ